MKLRFVLVHGYRSREGGKYSIDRLRGGLEARSHEVDTDGADYGYLRLWRVRYAWRTSDLQKRLTGAFRDADVIVAYSNGANYTVKTLNRMSEAKPNKVLIFMAPALNRDTPVPRWAGKVYCLHSPGDWLVRLSTYLLFHPWGRAGAFGLTAEDSRIVNLGQFHRVGYRHSGYFTDANIGHYSDLCADLAENHFRGNGLY